jgi:hypothetical protein
MPKNGSVSNWSVPQLVAAIQKAEKEAEAYRVELRRQIKMAEALTGGGPGSSRIVGAQQAVASSRQRSRRSGSGRKLVDDAKVVATLKKAGKDGIAASELGKVFSLKGGQMRAVLQRLASEKLAKSNGVRGRGGRWVAR